MNDYKVQAIEMHKVHWEGGLSKQNKKALWEGGKQMLMEGLCRSFKKDPLI